jgi:hypothetical protein
MRKKPTHCSGTPTWPTAQCVNGPKSFHRLLRFAAHLKEIYQIINMSCILKGTHARDFHRLFLNFVCIFQSLIDKRRSATNIFENIIKIRSDILNFRSLPVFAESAKHS